MKNNRLTFKVGVHFRHRKHVSNSDLLLRTEVINYIFNINNKFYSSLTIGKQQPGSKSYLYILGPCLVTKV